MPESSVGAFFAFCSETAGKSMEDKEPVMAVGNIISGRAIPVNTPNKLSASSVLNPASSRFCGI